MKWKRNFVTNPWKQTDMYSLSLWKFLFSSYIPSGLFKVCHTLTINLFDLGAFREYTVRILRDTVYLKLHTVQLLFEFLTRIDREHSYDNEECNFYSMVSRSHINVWVSVSFSKSSLLLLMFLSHQYLSQSHQIILLSSLHTHLINSFYSRN